VNTVSNVVKRVTPPYERPLIKREFESAVYPPEPLVFYFDQPSYSFDAADVGVSALSANSRNESFSRLLRKSAQAEFQKGNLSRMDLIRINVASRLPKRSKEIESYLYSEFDMEPDANGIIDWDNFDPDKFRSFVETVLLILKLFGIGV
jgi:hypothetical protein